MEVQHVIGHIPGLRCATSICPRVIDSYGLSTHMYADDTQVYGFCLPTTVATHTANITDCVEAATSWMQSNRLQPNPDKTEFLWCATARRQPQLPTSPLLIDGCSITPVQSARDLRIYIDYHLSMQIHVQDSVLQCFVTVLHCTMSDSLLRAIGHTFDARGCTGALLAGLWEQHASWPSGLPDKSTPVSPECGSLTDLPPEDPQSHIWCSHQSALAAGSRTNSV